MSDTLTPSATRLNVLPPNHAQRSLLHNELHARPNARIRIPALVVYVAVLNEGISRVKNVNTSSVCRDRGTWSRAC